MIGLTPKQKQLFDFIRSELDAKGAAPSLDQMAYATGCKTRGGIAAKLNALQSKGYINRTRYAHRAITIIEPYAVDLSPEVHRLATEYAVEHGVPLETATNDLLRDALGVRNASRETQDIL